MSDPIPTVMLGGCKRWRADEVGQWVADADHESLFVALVVAVA